MSMHDTILSFHKPSERPFVEAALLMGAHEDDVRRRHAEEGLQLTGGGVPFEVEGKAYSGDETLRVRPRAFAEERSGDLRRLKKCIVWWGREGWCARGAEAVWKSARAYLRSALEDAHGEEHDLHLAEALDTGPARIQAREEAAEEAIRHAFEARSLYFLRRAVYGYVRFYEDTARALAEDGDLSGTGREEARAEKQMPWETQEEDAGVPA